MNIFSLIIYIISVILGWKIIIIAYFYYITWKKLSCIPGPFAVPIIGTLELQTKNTSKGTNYIYIY